MKRPYKNLLFYPSLIALSVCVCLIMSEIFLRIIGYSSPNFYTYNDIVGHRLYPGTQGWFRKEGGAYITINSDSLRDREHSFEKPPNTVRIAVLGDSYAEAFQVPLEAAFWKVMERKLKDCPAFEGRQVEVINFGVSGDGTAQEFLTLQHYGWKYAPDIVLLAFLTGNDIRNNSKKLESNKLRPFFVLQDDTIVLDRSFVESPVYKQKMGHIRSTYRLLSRHLRVLQLCNAVKKHVVSSRKERLALLKGEEPGLDHHIYLKPQSSDWEEAWNITEAILKNMRQEIAQHNARLLVVTLSNGIQVHPDSNIRADFMRTFNIDNIFYPDDRLKKFGEKTGIEMLTLAPMLQKYAIAHQQPLHGFKNTTLGFGHWNEEGHRIAGEIIADYFCSEISLSTHVEKDS